MMKYTYEKILEEAGDKKVFFFSIPRVRDLHWYKENGTSPLGTELSAWANQYPNVYFLDLLPLTVETVPAENWHKLFNGCDRHWTEQGHELAAELIYKHFGIKLYL